MANEKKTLKDFFSGLFRKYPERAKRDGDEYRTVYGGPEYFRARKYSEGKEKPGFKRVYAGPEYFGKVSSGKPVAPQPEEEPYLEEVYAGPEYFEELSRREPADSEPEEEPDIVEVYAGPEYFERSSAGEPDDGEEEELFECVYAGPDYWGIPDGDEEVMEGPEAPEEAGSSVPDIDILYGAPGPEDPAEDLRVPQEDPLDDRAPSQMAFVYGGPEYFNNLANGPRPSFEGVYAGPVFNAEIQSPIMAPVYAGPPMMMAYAGPSINLGGIPTTQSPEDPSVCRSCGYRFEKETRFCPDCGAPNPNYRSPAEGDVRCPACGACYAQTAPSWPECGTRRQEKKAEERTVCRCCGSVYPADQRFCPECGALNEGNGPVAEDV